MRDGKQRRSKDSIGRLALLIGVLVMLDVGSFVWAERLWFQEVDYLEIFTTRLWSQGLLGGAIAAVSLSFLWGNLWLADRYSQAQPREKEPGQLRLRGLLLLTGLLSLLIGCLLLHYGQIAFVHWHPNFIGKPIALQSPVPLSPQAIWAIGQQVLQSPPTLRLGEVGLGVGLAIGLLIYPRLGLGAIGLVVSLSFSTIASEHWTTILLALSPSRFDQTEPLFGRDLGFYLFTLPLWELCEFWLVGLLLLGLLSVLLTYLLSSNSLSQGYFPAFRRINGGISTA